MLYLNEKEIIKGFLDHFVKRSSETMNLKLQIKKLHIEDPRPNELYKDFQDGKSSSETNVEIEIIGWKSYSDDGLKQFMISLLDDSDVFAPIVELEVFEISAKGKLTVNLIFKIVYARYEIETGQKIVNDLSTGKMNKNDVIREVEIRLSEIYSLLNKLKD
ncbi:MAG: hypothetical protein JXR69_09730 [Candidatus Delongbacteria bacterium]|nr:hypothetical protein [Candidatus Delongbacteria bacterium]